MSAARQLLKGRIVDALFAGVILTSVMVLAYALLHR